jgi:hypothetical protein
MAAGAGSSARAERALGAARRSVPSGQTTHITVRLAILARLELNDAKDLWKVWRRDRVL